MVLEYVFYRNKYYHPIMKTRKKGTHKWNCGYPYSVDGLVELETGETQGGREVCKLFCELTAKYKLTKEQQISI